MRKMTLLAAAAAVAFSGFAYADPPDNRGKGKGKGKNKSHQAEVYRGASKGHYYKRGGPPPWAPAHGYRAKRSGQRGGGDAVVAYVAPYGIDGGRCNRKELGIVLGGIGGALIGSRVASKDDKLIGIIGGGILGAVVGGVIGNRMDKLDQNCVGQTLEHAADGQHVAWDSDASGGRYQVTPTRSWDDGDGRYCREYQTTSYVNGREVDTFGTACRQTDGSWQQAS